MSNFALVAEDFEDGDELSAAVAAAGLDIELGQLDCGKLRATLKLAIGEQIVVQHFHLGRRFHQRGATPDGLLTFGLPDQFAKLTWSGRRMKRESLLNFSRRDGFDAVSDTDFTGYTFSIREDSFQNAVSALDTSFAAEQVQDFADYFETSGSDLETIRSLAYSVHYCARNGVAASRAVDDLEADLAHMLALQICATADVNVTLVQRQRAVEKALALILSTSNVVTVSDVYKSSAVSSRTLDRAFKERFGVSPRQYIVATKMVGVRRALLVAPRGSKISDIANDWGFWHLGRFAADYKNMFGELPSESSRRTLDLSNDYIVPKDETAPMGP